MFKIEPLRLSLCLALFFIFFSPHVYGQQQAEWTVMVFLNGDNNLEAAGINDFKEMAEIGSTDKINVIVQFDRIPGYSTRCKNWKQTLRFRVTRGMEPFPEHAIPPELGGIDKEENMGSGETLKEFVSWAMKKYPAKRYMLDIWDHGQGYRTFKTGIKKSELISTYRSVSVDESEANRDRLYNREIQDSMTELLGGKKVDVIGFDACLMSMVETAYALTNVAMVMVGSEELEPGAGWNYKRVLEQLTNNPTVDGPGLGKILVTAYEDEFSENDGTTTLSAIDLSKMDQIGGRITSLSESLISKLKSEFDAIQSARSKCHRYGEQPNVDTHHQSIDAIRFFTELEKASQDTEVDGFARQVADAISAAVIANYAGSHRKGDYGSNGLAIYFPPDKLRFEEDPNHEGYLQNNEEFPIEFVKEHRWDEFLQAFYQHGIQ